jgi:hypothetical protein
MNWRLKIGGYEFTYSDIPEAPTDGTTHTMTFTSPGNIFNTTGSSAQNYYLQGSWDEFHSHGVIGTSSAYRRFINLNSSTIIGGWTGSLFSREGVGSTYIGLFGRYSDAPLYFHHPTNTPVSSVFMSASGTTPHAIMQNIVSDSRGYGLFANSGGTLSGGNATTPATSSNNYQDITARFFRSFNAGSAAENYYIGSTSGSSYAIHQNLQLDNLLGYNSGREAIQIACAPNFSLRKSTFHTAGTTGTSAQDALFQVSNAYGTVEHCIFMNAPQALRFSTHDLFFRNNYVQWTGNKANEITGYYATYASTNRLMVNPITTQILIEDCDFVATTWTGALFIVYDPNTSITIRNCRISGATSLFQDARGGSPAGVLTDGGGNQFGATIETPTFSNWTPTDFTGHGLLTEVTNHQKGRGYRTP